MREFRKTERPSFWKLVWRFISSFFHSERGGFSGHNERMSKRRRKTKFDRW